MSRPIIPTYVMMGICVMIVFGGLILLVLGGYEFGDYQRRCQDCEPQELIPILEVKYGIKFPTSVIELKTAKSPIRDSMTWICIKLVLTKNEAHNFFSSFKNDIDRGTFTANWFFKNMKKKLCARLDATTSRSRYGGIFLFVRGKITVWC